MRLAEAFDRRILAFKMYGVIEGVLYSSINLKRSKKLTEF